MQSQRNEAGFSAEDVEEFRAALAMFKRLHRRPYPTCSEVLGVLKSLGYKKPNEAR